MQQKPYKSIRIFESPFLEFFSHVHPITPLFLWAPIVGWFIYRSFVVDHLSALSFTLARQMRITQQLMACNGL